MGIEVLPPDVNNSGYDFTIEEHTRRTRSHPIRTWGDQKTWVRDRWKRSFEARGHQVFFGPE